MKKVCQKGMGVKCLDVSHYDEVIDFKKVKAAGYEMVYIKATEGTTVKDKMFAKNRAAALAAGLLVGAYEFFHPSKDPIAQAKHIESVVGKLGPGEMPYCMDWESTDGVPASTDRERGLQFLEHVEKVTGKIPIIYGGPYFLDALKLDARFAKYPLWVSHYGVACPLVPAPWGVWSFWQTSDKGNVPGIPAANEDVDVFNGTLENLKKFAV
jgi:lysozyme